MLSALPVCRWSPADWRRFGLGFWGLGRCGSDTHLVQCAPRIPGCDLLPGWQQAVQSPLMMLGGGSGSWSSTSPAIGRVNNQHADNHWIHFQHSIPSVTRAPQHCIINQALCSMVWPNRSPRRALRACGWWARLSRDTQWVRCIKCRFF